MCGIAGIWGSDEGVEAAVGRMLDAIVHRGPDGQGTLTFPGGAAGMVRLALVDLSPKGQQPMWSPDGKVAILFNGEVYNFREHREALSARGWQFHSSTDTEVVLALYLEHGERFVEMLRGMYALAVFDFRDRGLDAPPKLVLVRGPFGIKPLYVAQPSGARGPVVFGSELKALLASGLVRREVSAEGLQDFLTYGFVLQPHTMIAGVRMVMPGTIEVFEPARPSTARAFYCIPPAAPRVERLEEAAERLRAVLDESVRLHAFADAKVGAFLSGGVDSAVVVALMKRHVPDLSTFTLRFPEVQGQDEAAEARETAAALGTRHFDGVVTGSDVRASLPRFAHDLDQPSVDGFNTWLVSKVAAEHVKGVLSGLGGDEWFAGYPVTARMAQLGHGARGLALGVAGRAAQRVAPLLPRARLRHRADSLAARADGLSTWLQLHRVFSEDQARALSSRSTPPSEAFTDRVPSLEGRVIDESAVGLSCLLDAEVYMGSQLLRDADATSMGWSLELRVPFVDLEVAAFSRSCADDLKLDVEGGRVKQKRVLLEAARGLIPPEIERRKKRGFSLPFADWMRGPAADLVEEALDPSTLRRRGLIDPGALSELRREGGARFLWPQAWSLLILEQWCQQVLDAPLPRDVSLPGSSPARRGAATA